METESKALATSHSPSYRTSFGAVPLEATSSEEHHEWAQKLWNRLDRDSSGFITSQELNCDELHQVIRSVLVPNNPNTTGSTSATYARSEMYIQQAIDFCLRKADLNYDGCLSFKEFRAFLRALRSDMDSKDVACWIFALFDLDGNLTIDREEFREVYRFYLGHHPTAVAFQEAWEQLDASNTGKATRADYVRWLQNSAIPLFTQHSEGLVGDDDSNESISMLQEAKDRKLLKGIQRPNPRLLPILRRRVRPPHRPLWNDRLNPVDIPAANKKAPKRMKVYFSRPQSLPELTRYCNIKRGCEEQAKRLAEKEEPRKPAVLSTDSAAMPMTMPSRHSEGGTMQNFHGETVPWMEKWQAPLSLRPTRRDPGANALRCIGPPPDWIKEYKKKPPPLKAPPVPSKSRSQGSF
mmetsp:Transcript_19622/g.53759  ORF Transcript_19622/g.53759 Transcript_19622/m.53759 type:complete len:408 (-) Transcript_19622:69-1292(-)